jgi:hypothetical protein
MTERQNEIETPSAMAEYLRTMGSETGDQIAAALERQQAAIELAYGLLWLCPTDRNTRAGELAYQARQALLPPLDRDGKLRGLQAAQDMLPAPQPRTNSRTVDAAVANRLMNWGKPRRD